MCAKLHQQIIINETTSTVSWTLRNWSKYQSSFLVQSDETMKWENRNSICQNIWIFSAWKKNTKRNTERGIFRCMVIFLNLVIFYQRSVPYCLTMDTYSIFRFNWHVWWMKWIMRWFFYANYANSELSNRIYSLEITSIILACANLDWLCDRSRCFFLHSGTMCCSKCGWHEA